MFRAGRSLATLLVAEIRLIKAFERGKTNQHLSLPIRVVLRAVENKRQAQLGPASRRKVLGVLDAFLSDRPAHEPSDQRFGNES
mgnify:CR=1 FL=1